MHGVGTLRIVGGRVGRCTYDLPRTIVSCYLRCHSRRTFSSDSWQTRSSLRVPGIGWRGAAEENQP